MTDAERDRCRDVQDRIVRVAERRGYSDRSRLSPDLPPGMTVGGLRGVLFPAYMAEMEALLRELEETPCLR